MPIPAQFNGDLSLWFNQIVSDMSEANTELMFLRRYWSSLTVQQKSAIRTKMQNSITSAKTSLDSISAEIGTI